MASGYTLQQGAPNVDNTTITYNGKGQLSVVPGSSGVVDSVANSDGTLTVSPTTGNVVASINEGHTNVWTIAQEFSASVTLNQSSQPTGATNKIFIWQDTSSSLNFDFGTSGTKAHFENDGTLFGNNVSLNGFLQGNGLKEAVTSPSSAFSPSANNFFILATGGSSGITVTLPTAFGSGQLYIIKKADSGAGAVGVNASTNGGTIDGVNSVSLTTQYWTVGVIDSGTDTWSIIFEIGLTSPL